MEPSYNEVLGTMKISLLYQISHYIRVKKQRNIKSWDQQNYLVIRGFCYIRPLYNKVPLYQIGIDMGNLGKLQSFVSETKTSCLMCFILSEVSAHGSHYDFLACSNLCMKKTSCYGHNRVR